MKKLAILAVLAVAGVGLLAGCESNVGVTTRSDILGKGKITATGDMIASAALVDGGAVTSASSSLRVAMSLTAAQICDSAVVYVTPGPKMPASVDITLAATSSLFADCLDTEGNEVSFLFCNNGTVAASTTQIVKGAGIGLMESDDSSDFNVEIGGGACAEITLTRFTAWSNTTEDAVVEVREMTVAD